MAQWIGGDRLLALVKRVLLVAKSPVFLDFAANFAALSHLQRAALGPMRAGYALPVAAPATRHPPSPGGASPGFRARLLVSVLSLA